MVQFNPMVVNPLNCVGLLSSNNTFLSLVAGITSEMHNVIHTTPICSRFNRLFFPIFSQWRSHCKHFNGFVQTYRITKLYGVHIVFPRQGWLHTYLEYSQLLDKSTYPILYIPMIASLTWLLVIPSNVGQSMSIIAPILFIDLLEMLVKIPRTT